MKRKRWWLQAAGVIVLTALLAAGIWIFSQKNTKEYEPSDEAFGNPLMGYAPCAWNAEVREDVSLLYMDITWGRTGARGRPVQLGGHREGKSVGTLAGGRKTHRIKICLRRAREARRIWIFLNGCMKKTNQAGTCMTYPLERALLRITTTGFLSPAIKKRWKPWGNIWGRTDSSATLSLEVSGTGANGMSITVSASQRLFRWKT